MVDATLLHDVHAKASINPLLDEGLPHTIDVVDFILLSYFATLVGVGWSQ